MTSNTIKPDDEEEEEKDSRITPNTGSKPPTNIIDTDEQND